MRRVLRDERGMALAVAIFALVVVGALVAGAFFAGTQEQRVGENQRRVQTSFGVAEAGVQEQVLGWNSTANNKRPNYPADSVAIATQVAPNGTGTYFGYSYKMGPNIFLLNVIGRDKSTVAGGTAAGAGAQQRIGLITRIAPVQFGIAASLTTQGSVKVGGNAEINGADSMPTGWTTCDPPGPSMAGVRDQGGQVTNNGNGAVTGVPPIVNDPSINSNTFTNFGGATFDQLAQRATVSLPGGTYSTAPVFNGDGSCDKTVVTNWGDGMNPGSQCGSYFPIIYLQGTSTLNNTQGQGILLVNGDLNIAGSYEFYGVVIIQGDIKTSGGGATEAHFWGGVMAKNADLSVQNITGKATLNFSSCAILQALQATSAISMMRSRGWTQLF